ncbi:MAG TPA: SDR family oxidoreductase [Acidimicrobiia bacterium]|nr:SDR family oxidoreductase [Acidimicrobiia bacterium]
MAESYRPLQGKVALITGGSRGLGAATARHLSRWGARVIITYRQRPESAEEVVAACSEETPGARAVQLDLTEEESVREAFREALEGEDRLDFLVANAAATALRPLLGLKMHQIDKTFAISVRHFILMVQLAFPLLEQSGGRVIAVSGADTVGYIPTHGLLAAAKSSMETLIRYLAAELGPTGVTAMGVLPGYIDTDSIQMMTGPLYETLKRAETESHPLREAASPEAAAEAIALLCLPEARWLNGQIVQNDGGGLFAMQARFFTAAVQAMGESPGESSPIVGI